jgi:hypothetical protein
MRATFIPSSLPSLTRLRGRSPFGAAKALQSMLPFGMGGLTAKL